MDKTGSFIVCKKRGVGKYYDFYYGHYLGSKEISHGGPGGINEWELRYRVIGGSSGFICKDCFRREYWKEFFKWENLKEIPIIIPLFCSYMLALLIKFFLGASGAVIQDEGVGAIMLFFLPIFIFILKWWIVYNEFGNEKAYEVTSSSLFSDPSMIFIGPAKFNALKPKPVINIVRSKPAPTEKVTQPKKIPEQHKGLIHYISPPVLDVGIWDCRKIIFAGTAGIH